MTSTLEDARARDLVDPLAHYRDAFHHPPDSVYLCGHSLGLQPKATAAVVAEELEDWKAHAVRGHTGARRPWLSYHENLAGAGAKLVGAEPSEIVHMNTLTVNLHLLFVSFYRPTSERHKIVVEKHLFPSDRYGVVSQIRFHGFDPAESLIEIDNDDELASVLEREGDSVALVWLGGVNYYSGETFDMARVVELGHAVGARVGFDLAHAAGNVALRLHDWNVDFAAWCTYKYLNAGPGAVAAAFVHERHGRGAGAPRFAGWWGHDKATRFRMGPEFVPCPGAEGWQLSNPPILSLAPVLVSLQMFDEVGMVALRQKSERLTGYFETLVTERLGGTVEIITPSAPKRRGAQLSLRLRSGGGGRGVFDDLSSRGMICDWREPDVIRAAPMPFYNRYEDVWRFVEALDAATR